MVEIWMLLFAGAAVFIIWAGRVATREWRRRTRRGGDHGDEGVMASDSHDACGSDGGCGGDGGGGD